MTRFVDTLFLMWGSIDGLMSFELAKIQLLSVTLLLTSEKWKHSPSVGGPGRQRNLYV